MAMITQRELNERIRQHEEWLKNEAKGNSPSFAGLDLSGLDLKGRISIIPISKEAACEAVISDILTWAILN